MSEYLRWLDSQSVAADPYAEVSDLRPFPVNPSSWTKKTFPLVTNGLLAGADLSDAPAADERVVIDGLIASAREEMRIDLIEETTGTLILPLHLNAQPVAIRCPGMIRLPTLAKKVRVRSLDNPGVAQVETATVAGTVTGAGDASVIVTAAGMTNSPKTVAVALLDGDDDEAIATKVRAALTLDADVSAWFTIGGAGANVALTVKSAAADDVSMNIAVANDSCVGIVNDASSVHTTAGVLGQLQVETATAVGTIQTGVLQVETATIVGTIQTAVLQKETATIVGDVVDPGYAIVTVTAAGAAALAAGKEIQVVLAALDDAATVADKIKTALGLDEDVTGFFTVGGIGTDVALTVKSAAANDATMNIAYTNGTCTGLTEDLTSTDTTAGAASGAGNVSVTVTAANAPALASGKEVLVAVAEADDDAAVAGKIITALDLDEDVAGFFTVGGSGADVTLETLAPADDDATMNIAIAAGTTIGLTPDATSANTVAGVASGAGNAKLTITGAHVAGSPLDVLFAVAEGDDDAAVAGKARTALAIAAITDNYTVGGAGADVSLTTKTKWEDDVSLNIASTNATCIGLTPDASSADTIAGVATGAGTAVVTVTANGMTNSPKAIDVALAEGDDASAIGGKIRTALNTADVTDFFTVSGAGADGILTTKAKAANDETMNIAIAAGDTIGLTPDASSADTTAGIAPVLQVETATIVGAITGSGDAEVTITSADLDPNPLVLAVPVTDGNAAHVAGEIRDYLDADADVVALWDVGGTGDDVALSRQTVETNDGTLNIAIATGTATGIDAAPTSTATLTSEFAEVAMLLLYHIE